MSNQDELIAQFIEISGGEESVARFYLSSSNWSLEDALSNFLGSQSENDNATPEIVEMPSSGDMDDSADEQPGSGNTWGSSGGGGGGGGVATGTTGDNFMSKSKPKFGTLKDMTKRTNSDEEGQAFYAGGSERSGQQVLGPPKRKNFREQLTDMFRMAQESSTPDDAAPTPSTSSAATWGQGVRLGMTDTDHSVVSVPNPNNKEGGEKGPVVVLKLWSQGFSINDGELRLYDNPDNKEFLETVMRGEIPHELLEMGWMVNVDVEDHRHEDYKKTTKAPNFKGSGHTLGSPTPNVQGADAPVPVSIMIKPSASTATAAVNTNSSDDEKRAKEKLNINSAAPLTTLQIRLADGTRLAAQFNLTHTVGDIHQYIQNARPQYAEQNFILVSSFPTRELTDKTATIELAGLKNAAVMQRLK